MAYGKKTGGRQKGTKNRRTRERMALVAQATSDGISPLEVMLGAMRQSWSEGDHEAAAGYARDAAPYVHPRLANVQHSGDADNPVETVTRIELTAPEVEDRTHRTAPEVAVGLFRPS